MCLSGKEIEAFEVESERLISKGQETYIDSPAYRHSGHLVFLNGAVAIVCEDYNYVHLLPKFIKTGGDFQAYIRILNKTYQEGLRAGKEYIKADFRKLLQSTT